MSINHSTPPTPHKTIAQVRPHPSSVVGGAGMPDNMYCSVQLYASVWYTMPHLSSLTQDTSSTLIHVRSERHNFSGFVTLVLLTHLCTVDHRARLGGVARAFFGVRKMYSQVLYCPDCPSAGKNPHMMDDFIK